MNPALFWERLAKVWQMVQNVSHIVKNQQSCFLSLHQLRDQSFSWESQISFSNTYARGKIMKKERIYGWILIFLILIWLPISQVRADGGYFSPKTESSQSVAVSADQRAIIIKNGDEISMTFSTGYTGEGEDFGRTIPTPVPSAIEDASETGKLFFGRLIAGHSLWPSSESVLACGKSSLKGFTRLFPKTRGLGLQ